MENKKRGATPVGDTLLNGIQTMADVSLNAYKSLIETALNQPISGLTVPTLKIPTIKLENCDCCPPEQKCPPHCIASITRNAMPGERIIVPIMVKNTCSTQKTYRIGVRELKNIDGQLAPFQPQLNRDTITLQPNETGRALMMIDLGNFTIGTSYQTEIVLREKDINQNICFTLHLNDHQTPIVALENENNYKLRWQSWKSHFYCEPPMNKNSMVG